MNLDKVNFMVLVVVGYFSELLGRIVDINFIKLLFYLKLW